MDQGQPAFTTAWNSHIAALTHMSRAAGQSHDAVNVAGVTGGAFRVALCKRCTPPSLYQTWSHPHYFAQWLPVLGVDAAVLWHPAGAGGTGCWLKRVREMVRQSTGSGHSVIYWDNLAFSVITGVQGEWFLSAGIWRDAIHPALADPLTHGPYLPRLKGDDQPGPFEIGLTAGELTGQANGDMFFACPLEVFETDGEPAPCDSLGAIARELSGRLEYPRALVADGYSGETQRGLAALERLIDELQQGQVHHFGLVQFIQAQAEARRWGAAYLKRAAADLPEDLAPRLIQAAVFFERSSKRWGGLALRFGLPLDSDVQMSRESLRACADELYHIHKTEETARRLIASIAQELGPQ